MYLQVTGTKLSYMYDLCLCVCIFIFMDAFHAFETRPSAEGSAILYARLTFTF